MTRKAALYEGYRHGHGALLAQSLLVYYLQALAREVA